MSQRIGIGYDIYRLVEGRKLFLGGVEIPFEKGLDGHSDADVLLHALCDALLGAVGKGDIGEHFPNTDKTWEGISSVKLLEHVFALVKHEGYKIGNVDVALLAEKPSIKFYKDQMRLVIGKVLAVTPDNINIKATTNEGLGDIGQGKGIAAFATVLLVKV